MFINITRDVYGADVQNQLIYINNLVSNNNNNSFISSNEPFPIDKINFIKFERLSVASHHYCDVLLLYNSNTESTSNEMKNLRSDIFYLIMSTIKLIKDRIDVINIELTIKDRLNLVTEDNFKTERNVLKNELIMLLKRGSEAGNDLYGVSSDYSRKVEVADFVFTLLNVSSILYFIFYFICSLYLYIYSIRS